MAYDGGGYGARTGDSRGRWGDNPHTGWVRVSRRNPCPICEHPDWCAVTADGAMAHCMRTASDRQASDDGWLHWLFSFDPKERRPEVRVPDGPTGDALDADAHHDVACELQRHLRLEEAHWRSFLARGMTIEAIARRGYRSIVKTGIWGVMRTIAERVSPERLMRVPGVVRRVSRHGPYLTMNTPPGILIPVRDLEGRIVAYRTRPDETSGGGKYRWLSSGEGGPSPGAPVHVAWPREMLDPDAIVVTEGEIKSDITADRVGSIVLSVPGASNVGRVPAIVQEIQRRRCEETGNPNLMLKVGLAFDADKHDPTKPSVLLGEQKLARELATIAHVYEISWPIEAGKGIDDLLVAGGRPEVRGYPFPPARPRIVVATNAPPRDDEEAEAERRRNEEADERVGAAWSTVPEIRGPVTRSQWCMKARLWYMGGDGALSDAPKQCGKWGCGDCATWKLEHEILPHLALCLKPLEQVWVGRVTREAAFHQCVSRARREGGTPSYVRIKRRATSFSRFGTSAPGGGVDLEATISLGDVSHVVANMDLGPRDEPWTCMSAVDAYQVARQEFLAVPDIVEVRFHQPWRIPAKPKREVREHVAYTLPSTMRDTFEKLADEAEDRWGIRPVFRGQIADPEVRGFVHEGLKKLRSADNPMHWGRLEDEEWLG